MESAAVVRSTFDQLGLRLFERGWLSSNNVLFGASRRSPATMIDTGYVAHQRLTQAMVEAALVTQRLERILNTHLHSDHAGGNARLQARWDCEALVPEASLDTVRRWDAAQLSYDDTGQQCPRFRADSDLRAGDCVVLGGYRWQVAAAPGHDPEAMLLYQPDSGVAIVGDALWEHRLAIVFPALYDDRAFGEVLATLDLVERLAPRIVIPGHGPAFTGVAAALERSRRRVAQFIRQPERHLDYAERALLMFHLLEQRQRPEAEVRAWLCDTPVFQRVLTRRGLRIGDAPENAQRVIDSLVAGGRLRRRGDVIALAGGN